jgi:hypothetical protein
MVIRMSKRLVVFVGYDSKSYELVRKLLGYNFSNIELIHIPEVDDKSLTDTSFPTIIAEEVCDGELIREEVRRLSEIRYYIEYEDETYNTVIVA